MEHDASAAVKPANAADVREYVEKQLDAVVRARPDLNVVFQGRGYPPLIPIGSPLWWTIESYNWDEAKLLIERRYVVEARLDEQQFVIWFGGLAGFPGNTARDVILPAVHVPFPWSLDAWIDESPLPGVRKMARDFLLSMPETVGVFFGKPLNRPRAPSEYGLGPVLHWMLEHQTVASGTGDPLVFPMTGCRY